MSGIYWKEAIRRGLKIRVTTIGWNAGGKFVYWHGNDAREAQLKLRVLSKGVHRKRRGR